MSKFFKRQELERLQTVNPDEIELVMKYQKRLPILIENDEVQGFCIDVRTLYKQIIGSSDMSHFSRWIKRAIKNYGFAENVDFTTISPLGRGTKVDNGGDIKSIDYYCSMDMAKQLAMVDKKETGFIARKYFILMERIVKENKDWLEIRDPEKLEYKRMSEAINDWSYRIWHKSASKSAYCVEADGINKIVTGKTSQELKLEYRCPTNELIRDYLKKDHNDELLFLEKQNQVLLAMDMGFTERMNMLAKMHEVTFKKNVSQRVA